MVTKEEIEEVRKKFEEKQQMQKQQWNRWALEHGVDIVKNDWRISMKFKIGNRVREKKDTRIGIITKTFKDWCFVDYGCLSGVNLETYFYTNLIKVGTKPKVYAWDRSAIKEQNKLQQEQIEVEHLKDFIDPNTFSSIEVNMLKKYNVVWEN